MRAYIIGLVYGVYGVYKKNHLEKNKIIFSGETYIKCKSVNCFIIPLDIYYNNIIFEISFNYYKEGINYDYKDR